MKKRILLLLTVLSLSFLIAGCNGSSPEKPTKPVIAVSIVPEKEFVRAVAGDLVDVVTMIPPGSSPSNYQPTPLEMESFSNASIYFAIGVPAEDANILKKAKELNPQLKIVRLDDEVGKMYPHRYFEDAHSHEDELTEKGGTENNYENHDIGIKDPHIWMSPKRVMVMVDTIASELSKMDSENSETYISNAKSYKEKLSSLDLKIKQTLEGLPNKSFIIYHPSLGYFADDYGLEMVSVESSGKSASAKELEYIIDFAREKNIKVVFYQSEIDSSQSRTLANEIEGKTTEISTLSGNYIENMEKIASTFKEVLQ
ncbi:zinc transport system substrate-binding protein [Peptoclostridium litorale DSM 5388]|uniref:Zinc-binding protein AdcA n=1 Tax=Peptoclostridium litorale DSM 5388 TaxID=1121324 RepID=A0A069RBH5_PEPLI|nr:zinc ABC transporter substrate-binding protein [Peptoclostridium litorale]KDR94401.1 zinc-binding protein AdcA [Peptoclostridium litorale DSM 5388]SIO24491.1 zinc transport system substrate-binding protein [Peptoclostridium litorale DSM 5388]